MRVDRIARSLKRGSLTLLAHALPLPKVEGPLWIFGGASGRSYSDNSRITHERVRQSRIDVDARWVIDANSPDLPQVQASGNAVTYGSLSAQRLARSAEVIVFSHGIHDVPGLMWNRDAIRVRLGHGLTAFNRTKGRTPSSIARLTRAITLAPVASAMERAHKAEWGFDSHQLPITGLARWDAMLAEHDSAPPRQRPLVFYAPTSRPWHTEADSSPDGALQPVHDFLRSPRLRAHLEAGTFELAVYFHQITRYRFGSFDWLPDGVRVVDEEAILPHLIATASLVISDYSSILWDALYLDTPVIFFQFDRAEHTQLRGSYIDLQRTLFGPNVKTADQVLDAIDEAVDDGFELRAWEASRQEWQERAFAYRDANNAARIIEAIEERLDARRNEGPL